MKFTYNWLKDYVDVKLAPEALAERLTMAGLEVTSLERRGGDAIFEVEVTSNRQDWLSIIGIAREVAAVTGARLKTPKSVQSPKSKVHSKKEISIKIEDKKGCARYIGRLIKDVKVAASPEWIRARLEPVGMRPVNNIVDITNYCLLEYGQPLHAFDYDKLKGGAIVVRRAKANEEITTIDGIKRKLDADTLVIADSLRPVALAGVMGGLDTEVSGATKNILLESAYFAPALIRRASKKLALASESSYRFERNVDIKGVEACSRRAAGLIVEVAGGSIVGAQDAGAKKRKMKKISLRVARLNKILGASVDKNTARKTLVSLGFKIVKADNKHLEVAPPAFRQDIAQEIDLIEEVARIYGYDKLPSTMPAALIKDNINPISDAKVRTLLKLTRDILCATGADEIITYSLISNNILSRAGLDNSSAIAIKNPLSAEQEIMRPTLLASLLGAIANNINKRNTDVGLFELGNIYRRKDDGSYEERLHLSIGLTGARESSWQRRPEPVDIFDLKGALAQLFERLGIKDYTFKETERQFLEYGAEVLVGGLSYGILGGFKRALLERFDIKQETFAAELDMEYIFGKASLERPFSAPARYPSISRDVAFIIRDGIRNEDIISLIRSSGGELASGVKLFDLYRGGQVPAGNVSLAYNIEFSHAERTLTDEEVNALIDKIKETLTKELGAKIR